MLLSMRRFKEVSWVEFLELGCGLELGVVGSVREGDDVVDVFHVGDELYQLFKVKAEFGMWGGVVVL